MALEQTGGGRATGSDKTCSRCGTGFHCGRESGEPSCWCAAVPNVLSVPAVGAGAGCLCPDCLARAVDEACARAAPARLVPPPRPQ